MAVAIVLVVGTYVAFTWLSTQVDKEKRKIRARSEDKKRQEEERNDRGSRRGEGGDCLL